MSVIDELLENNKAYAATFGGPLPLPPSRKLAVVACMDSRIDVFGVLGLRVGEAHVIRNAGGVVTDSEIRSLAISQWMMGTREVVLVHHTECGMLTFTDEEFKERLHAEVGVKPTWEGESFNVLDADLRRSIARIRDSPFVPHTEDVRGFVLDVTTGRLREVV